jgi:hypothetical protein
LIRFIVGLVDEFRGGFCTEHGFKLIVQDN